jgi:predicted transcriptional regulator
LAALKHLDKKANDMTDQTSGSSQNANYIELAADIVSAFVSNNSVPAADLPALIASVHGALQNVGSPVQAPEAPAYQPAVPVKKSITPDAIISLIDGKPYKSLKRHLTGHGLTPDQYRERYGLSRDYPMVAASYAQRRSDLAKSLGLGQMRGTRAKAAATSEKVSATAPKKRGRKKAS